MWVSSWVIALQAAVFFLILAAARSQKTSRATTAVAEAKALNSIFEEWKISANTKQWNTTGDPCSGVALGTSPTMDDTTYDPFIKCDCSDNNGTTCHIIALKVYALDVVGVLPDELWSLTFLQNLKLGQNYLTGPISPSIGNLTQLQYLDFGINALSGELPKELGGLKNLISLGLGANNFSGSLPSELGSLTNLQQLYIDSSGVSGVIPSTFADLQSLQTVWASDVKFTGSIPDFIGNWTQLITLRLEGNSFSGSIPSKFSTLASLQELRISDISNGSSSLSFVNNLKSLTNLVLRNNNITGPIPSALGELQSLGHLDLSFNNLAGEIPESIFNIGSLSYLFLGNNKLTGNLPVRKSTTLLNIDVSYNELSGSLPTWINDESLQLNLVANNFSMSNSPGSVLPGGLNCLQRNFPCNGGLGRYYSFAVKCGGPQITSADQVTYERDNQTLGPATYFVIDTDRWAVSNVGLPTSNNNRTYTIFSPHQFTSTLDSELFQTARLSAGSLRYYGLGLENGNYTVLLQFAEIQIENGKTWRALGKRIFDILIQGNVVAKDFDIRKEAGNQSFKAVKKTFTAQVTSNHLEIHLFWAGKGTCCIPQQGVYGPSISAISVTPNFPPKVSNKPPSKNKSHTGLILGIVIPVGILGILSLAACWFIQRKKRSQGTEELLGMDNKPFTFAYAELRSATGDFDSSNKLGEGGFGPVFKGTLNDGRVVAVKQLSVASHQGQNQFIAEIATISAVQHRNLVKLYGCCINGEKRLLVYEYLENKSLDQALFGKSNLELNWGKRFDICMGVARGLAYLHEESRLRIVHRDVKASNILLDSDLNPKISDFGLAKLYDDKKTHISTRVAGTIGYLAPEYAMRGHLTEKVDVFGFGVVALEIVSGRPNSDTGLDKEKAYLLEWAWHLHENNRLIELVDARLSEFNEDEVKQVIRVALLCTQTSPTQRPTMSRVVAMLAGDIEVEAVISKPGYLADWSFDDASFMGGDASTSNYGYSSTSKSTGTNAVNSPADVTLSMVSDTVGSGR